MKLRQLAFSGLLVTLLSTAFAQQQALITVNPNLFAPGQNISDATTGAQLQALFAQPNPASSGLIPLYRPVFAQPVAAGCTLLENIPCTFGGNLAFGYTPTTIPSAVPILWGDVDEGRNCVLGGPCNPELMTIAPVLRVNFEVPTDLVSAIAAHIGLDSDSIEAFEAFDSTGQLLEVCIGPPFSFPAGCSTDLIGGGNQQFSIGWAQLTISRPTADISFVLIGGSGNFFPISRVQFDSPVSVQLAGLLAKVQGVGPGKSLANTMLQAQADYAAGDTLTTCSLLASFIGEVSAQDGKHIDHLTALQLVATGKAVETGIGCQ